MHTYTYTHNIMYPQTKTTYAHKRTWGCLLSQILWYSFSHSTSSTCTTLFQFICSVANVMFLETAITVEESAGFMTVCINISGGIPDTTIVRLSTVASTATGKLLSN